MTLLDAIRVALFTYSGIFKNTWFSIPVSYLGGIFQQAPVPMQMLLCFLWAYFAIQFIHRFSFVGWMFGILCTMIPILALIAKNDMLLSYPYFLGLLIGYIHIFRLDDVKRWYER